MYRIRKSIDIDFAHHVRGHLGPCINVHGHTWKFEVGIEARALDAEGFVVDFKRLKRGVLQPAHALLDHSLALGADSFAEAEAGLAQIGGAFLASRQAVHGAALDLAEPASPPVTTTLYGARNHYPGGMKVAVFPFAPTSERLAQWLYEAAAAALDDGRVRVAYGRVYETLHPVQAVAEYEPDR
jgi:6-pyruvoyl-tetrahydropterin synthase